MGRPTLMIPQSFWYNMMNPLCFLVSNIVPISPTMSTTTMLMHINQVFVSLDQPIENFKTNINLEKEVYEVETFMIIQ
jgi:hypothetical protein